MSETLVGRPRRLLAGLAGSSFWLGLGAFVGWATVHFWESWQLETTRHDVLLVGFALCATVGGLWLVASARLVGEIRWRLAEERSGTAARPPSALSYLLAPLAAPIVGMIVALSSPPPGAALGAAPATARAAAPAVVPAPASVAGTASWRQYSVRAGDTLVSIAEREYGDAEDWSLLAAANLGRAEPGGARFIDPTVLHAGWLLTLPPPGAARAAGLSRLEPVSASLPTSVAAVPDTWPSGGGSGTSRRDPLLLGSLAALGTLGALVAADGQRRRRQLQSMRAEAGTHGRPRPHEEALAEAMLAPLAASPLVDLVTTANRLLSAVVLSEPGIEPPRVGVVRVAATGVELLLEAPAPTAPPPFAAAAGGRSWWLPIEVAVQAAAAVAGQLSYLPVLVPLGEDSGSSYLLAAAAGERIAVGPGPDEVRRLLSACAVQLDNAMWAEVELFCLGSCNFIGSELAEEITPEGLRSISPPAPPGPGWRAASGELQPVVLVEDPAAAASVGELDGPAVVIGPLAAADRELSLLGGRLRLEPLGIEVPARVPAEREARILLGWRAWSSAAGASALAAGPTTVEHGELDGVSLAAAPPADPRARPRAGSSGPAPADAAPERRRLDLPVAAAVEVRLLRAAPDLVGDLHDEPSPAAVQLVAYLALHGGSASTHALREALGVYRRDQSAREKTIYNAASATRRALGRERFPLVVGNEPYRLGPGVSCDWVRFQAAQALAAAARRGGDLEHEVDALRFALELVGDGMPASDKALAARFVWLDAELVLEEIGLAVLDVSHRLGTLGFGLGDLDLVGFAVERGRQVAPESDQLRELAILLADARGERSRAAAELDEHVRSVDRLGLGADLSERIEVLASELALHPLSSYGPTAQPPSS